MDATPARRRLLWSCRGSRCASKRHSIDSAKHALNTKSCVRARMYQQLNASSTHNKWDTTSVQGCACSWEACCIRGSRDEGWLTRGQSTGFWVPYVNPQNRVEEGGACEANLGVYQSIMYADKATRWGCHQQVSNPNRDSARDIALTTDSQVRQTGATTLPDGPSGRESVAQHCKLAPSTSTTHGVVHTLRCCTRLSLRHCQTLLAQLEACTQPHHAHRHQCSRQHPHN